MFLGEKNLSKKIISLILVIIMISSPILFAFPQKANATGIPVFDAAVTFVQSTFNSWDYAWENAIKPLLSALGKLVAISLIQNITQSTVNWIKSGFQGNPSFIGDPAGVLQNTADQAIGEMIFRDPALNFLCSPFQIQVKLALGLQFQDFSRKINCTLSGISKNVNYALNNSSISLNGSTIVQGNKFVNSGGWDNWIQMTTQPQNNPTGAFLIAKSELDDRIANKKDLLNQQLNWGTGALSFNRCSERYYDAKTGDQIGPTNTYIGSESYAKAASGTVNYLSITRNAGGNPTGVAPTQYGPVAPGQSADAFTVDVTSKTTCDVATPGAIITNMLGFQTGSNERIGELQAALSTGLDQVLSALASQLIRQMLTSLTQGVLGNNSNTIDYKKEFQDLQNQYNQQINSTSSIYNVNTSSFTNTYDQFAGQGYSNNFNSFNNSYSNQGESLNPTTETTDPLYVQRQNALARINSLENSELQFQTSMTNAKNLLTKGKIVFVTAENCNTSHNTQISNLRSFIIDANVVTNIDGTRNINRTIANIPWNLISIAASASSSNANIDFLDIAKNNVYSATTSQGIITALTPITSIQFNTDPQASTTDYISTWLRGVRDAYTTDYCPINLTSVFATSTTH